MIFKITNRISYAEINEKKRDKYIYHQQNNPIVRVKSFLVPYVVFFDIHFLDQQLLVDDVQLMDLDSKKKIERIFQTNFYFYLT